MSDKPLLFLLPGLMCDETVWLDQRDALAAHAEVIIPVFRGFDSLVDMATHVLDQASGHFSVVGHSMGGRVAWELMSLAPERIERFCVMDTGYTRYPLMSLASVRCLWKRRYHKG